METSSVILFVVLCIVPIVCLYLAVFTPFDSKKGAFFVGLIVQAIMVVGTINSFNYLSNKYLAIDAVAARGQDFIICIVKNIENNKYGCKEEGQTYMDIAKAYSTVYED